MIDILRSHKNTIISLILIFVLGLLPITWFGDGYLFSGTDFYFPPNGWKAFLQTLYSWDSRSLGTANPRMHAWLVPQGLFIGFSDITGLPLEISQKMWLYFLYTYSGLSMFVLSTTIMKKQKFKNLAGLLSAFLYMLNPYVAIGITTFPYLWLTYSSLPLKLALYVKGINERRGLKYVLFVNLIWWITSSSQYVNPKYVILDWLPIFLYLTLHVLINREREEILTSLKFTGIFSFVWISLNFYWLLPTTFFLKEEIEAHHLLQATIGLNRSLEYALNSAPLLDALRLLGFWAIHSGFKGYPYFYWAKAYYDFSFILIGYIIPLISLTPLLLKRDKHVLFFNFLLLIALLLMNGIHPPLGIINVYIITNIPHVLDIFSTPYQIFGMYVTLSYAFLFGYGVTLFFNYAKKVKLDISSPKCAYKLIKAINIIFIVMLIFLVIGLYAFPIWTGEVIYPGNPILASNRYKIPKYYYDAGNWLSVNEKEYFRVFQIPYSIIGYGSYTWEPAGFQGPDPTEFILCKPLVSGLSGNGIGLFISRLIMTNSTNYISKILTLINAKYILLHNDANWKYLEENPLYVSTSTEMIQSLLKSQHGLHLEKTFGKLSFYKNEYWKPMHMYAVTKSIVINGDLYQILHIVKREDYKPNEFAILLSNQLDINQMSTLPLDIVFFQNSDFLSLALSKTKAYVINLPREALISIHGSKMEVSATFSVESSQVYDLWIKMPYSPVKGLISVTVDGLSIISGFSLPLSNLMAPFWIKLGEMPLSKGNHKLVLVIIGGEVIPEKVLFVAKTVLNSTCKLLSDALYNARIVHVLEPQPLIMARYYSGWKGVISTNGQGDPDMLIFSSPNECPYIDTFPPASPTGWNAYNSTLIYIMSGSSTLMINSVLADGKEVSANAWWETGTSWKTGWPIAIPPNQRAIIQINEHANFVTLQTDKGAINLRVLDGWANPPVLETTSVISTNIFVPKTGKYLVAVKITKGCGEFAVKFDDREFIIDLYPQEKGSTFIYKYIGPVHLVAGYHKFSISRAKITIPIYDSWTNPVNWTFMCQEQPCVARYYADWKVENVMLYSLREDENFLEAEDLLSLSQPGEVSIAYEKINPTKYVVHVNASTSFFLVFSESYHKGWLAYIDGRQVPSEYHLMANGYANAWFINKTGTYEIILEFWPQNLFYIGSTISIVAIISCVLYVNKDTMKNFYKRYIVKNQSQVL